MKNAHLVNAARYIDAIHDIFIDEDHPNLAWNVKRLVEKLDCPKLDNYWQAYQLEINPELANQGEGGIKLLPNDNYSEKPTFYRVVQGKDTFHSEECLLA